MANKIELLQKIKHLSDQLVKTATEFGFTDEKTVKISQQLDLLLNEYQLIKMNEYESFSFHAKAKC